MNGSGFHAGLLGLTLLAGGAAAAQDAATYDPAQLPAFHGRVAQYDLSSRGGVDGLILDDGTEVHMDRHSDDRLVAAIKPGDTVTIHGLKARTLKLIEAMSITNDATRATVADTDDDDDGDRHGDRHEGDRHGDGNGRGDGHEAHGRGHRHGRGDVDEASAPTTLDGRIQLQLHDAAGNLDGVLLDDRTIVLIETSDVEKLAGLLAVGQPLFVRGDVQAGATGKMIRAAALGASAGQLTDLRSARDER